MVAAVRAPCRPKSIALLHLLLALACWLVAPVALARGAAVDSATAAEQQKAQELYAQGVQLFKAGRHAEAAEAFRKSFDVVASPNSHIMHARSLREAGKLAEAYEEFALTQSEASELATRLPKYASTAESAEAELAELRKRVALLSVEVKGAGPGVTLRVGSREVPHERWREIAVEPGTVTVSARQPDGRHASQSVQARQSELTRLTLDFGAGAPGKPGNQAAASASGHSDQEFDTGAGRRSNLKPWAFVAGGVGVAGLVTFGVFGAMSRSTFSDLEDSCPSNTCPPERQDDIDKGKQQQLIANIGLAVGVVGVGTGVTLFLLDGAGEKTGTRARLRAVAGPGSISVRGTF